MAGGVTWDPGGVAAPSDVRDAGAMEWATVSGIEPWDPIMGGGFAGAMGGTPGIDPDRRFGTIVTLPLGQGAPAPDAEAFDDWRDLFDFRNSPAPWVLLGLLAAIGFVQLRVTGRAGPFSGAAGVG